MWIAWCEQGSVIATYNGCVIVFDAIEEVQALVPARDREGNEYPWTAHPFATIGYAEAVRMANNAP